MKKMLSLLLAASLLTASLAACGGASSSAAPAASSAAPSSAAPSSSTASTEPVKIGAIGPNTGSLAAYGEGVANAIKMAVAEINADGGVLGGRELKVVAYMDDKADATEASNAFNNLMSQGVKAVIGSVTSGVTSGLATLADEEGMLLLTPTATNDDVTIGYPSVFRACYADSYQSSICAKFMAESLKVTKVGVLYASGDAYSMGMAEGFKNAAKALGLEIVGEESTGGTSDTDYNAQWANLKASGAEAVFAPFYYDSVGPYIVPQARAAGFEGAIVGADGYDGTVDMIVEPASQYNNVYFTNHYASDDPSEKVQKFVKGYEAIYKATPNALAALAYDSVYMLKQAIEAAGTDDTAAVVQAMTGMSFDGVTGTFTLDENNTPAKSCAIIEIKDGKMVWKDTVG